MKPALAEISAAHRPAAPSVSAGACFVTRAQTLHISPLPEAEHWKGTPELTGAPSHSPRRNPKPANANLHQTLRIPPLPEALSWRGVDSVIFGVVSFDFDGTLWQDYLAEHAEGQWWRFGVEPDRDMKLAAFEPRELGVEPGPDIITYLDEQHRVTESGLDEQFRVTESGHANYRTAGQVNQITPTSQFETGRYAYFDYENNAGVILSSSDSTLAHGSPRSVTMSTPSSNRDLHRRHLTFLNRSGE